MTLIARANPVFRPILSGVRIAADVIKGSGGAVCGHRGRGRPRTLGLRARLTPLAAGDREQGWAEAKEEPDHLLLLLGLEHLDAERADHRDDETDRDDLHSSVAVLLEQ